MKTIIICLLLAISTINTSTSIIPIEEQFVMAGLYHGLKLSDYINTAQCNQEVSKFFQQVSNNINQSVDASLTENIETLGETISSVSALLSNCASEDTEKIAELINFLKKAYLNPSSFLQAVASNMLSFSLVKDLYNFRSYAKSGDLFNTGFSLGSIINKISNVQLNSESKFLPEEKFKGACANAAKALITDAYHILKSLGDHDALEAALEQFISDANSVANICFS